jgi:hypothetical protein
MVMPRFAQFRQAIRTPDALVISCWLASNAFLLTSCLDMSPDSSGAGALFAWIVLLAFGLLWLVDAACDQTGHSPAEQAGRTVEPWRIERPASVILMEALKRSSEAEGVASGRLKHRPAAKSKPRTARPRKHAAHSHP